jgi:TorA maturation chaperone TorD
MNASVTGDAVQAMNFVRDPVGEEDAARASHYALVSRLFHDAPDAALLAALAEAGDRSSADGAPSAEAVLLAQAWQALAAAAAAMDEAAARAEFDALFGGLGRPQIVVFASFHLAGFINEKPLAKLRDDLAGLGLARARGQGDPEDHIAALADVMRFLLTDESLDGATRAQLQDRFFATHIAPWYGALFDMIDNASAANFYRRAGQYARCFLDIESAAMQIDN